MADATHLGKVLNFCTYSFIEQERKSIVHAEVIDNRQVKLQSPNMENYGLTHSLDFLLKHVTVSEVITDASTSLHKTLGYPVLCI